jgi:hypothetical protein
MSIVSLREEVPEYILLILLYIFRPFWTPRRYLDLRLDAGLGRYFG